MPVIPLPSQYKSKEELMGELYDFLSSPSNIVIMEQKIAENLPPVLGIEVAVQNQFPSLFTTVKSANYWKSAVGKLVHRILMTRGYTCTTRLRFLREHHGAQFYSSGMRYRKEV